MRQIVLDTETTGLDPKSGHRIIEIGCIELQNRRITEKTYHQYLNPERDIDQGAIAVHGLTLDFLKDKPTFYEIIEDFLKFIKGAELIIHNAPFDVGFINAEFLRSGRFPSNFSLASYCRIVDTLPLARSLHPGQRNSLDILCKRYKINNSHRAFHGALLDADLLAQVYLALTGGQSDFSFAEAKEVAKNMFAVDAPLENAVVVEASNEEKAAHQKFLDLLEKTAGKPPLWRTLEEL